MHNIYSLQVQVATSPPLTSSKRKEGARSTKRNAHKLIAPIEELHSLWRGKWMERLQLAQNVLEHGRLRV